MRHTPIIGFLALSLVTCFSCREPSRHDGRVRILATTGMVADMVRNIVGDSAIVDVLMHPGVDPHLYKASQGDLRKILDADYLVYNGLHLEGKLVGILEKQSRVKPVIAVSDGLDKLIRAGQNLYDPHIWFDVMLWKEATARTAGQLMQLDTAKRDYYRVNTKRYMQQLDTLDGWVRQRIHAIPTVRRTLITAHDAFSYFGRAYGIKVRGLQGISTLSEFGLRDVSNLVNFIVTHQIPAVFVESSVSDRSLKAVLEGVRKRGGHVHIGGHLLADALGGDNTPEGTYIGMVKHNVNTIVKALADK